MLTPVGSFDVLSDVSVTLSLRPSRCFHEDTVRDALAHAPAEIVLVRGVRASF